MLKSCIAVYWGFGGLVLALWHDWLVSRPLVVKAVGQIKGAPIDLPVLILERKNEEAAIKIERANNQTVSVAVSPVGAITAYLGKRPFFAHECMDKGTQAGIRPPSGLQQAGRIPPLRRRFTRFKRPLKGSPESFP
jgi:hypothetical protein